MKTSETRRIAAISLFPEMFQALTGQGISGRAFANDLLSLDLINPRDFTHDKHRTVDDRPYGGGPGMVMMYQPLKDAIAKAKQSVGQEARVIAVSPQGRRLDQAGVEELAQRQNIIFVCGRYEGIDERLIQSQVDEEWSIGDYVLSGGEFATMVMLDAVIRCYPGALGHQDSAREDSFFDGLLDCPHYTRPESIDKQIVPDVLLSGNHKDIARWRLKQALSRTWQRRPDLLEKRAVSDEEQQILDELSREIPILKTNT